VWWALVHTLLKHFVAILLNSGKYILAFVEGAKKSVALLKLIENSFSLYLTRIGKEDYLTLHKRPLKRFVSFIAGCLLCALFCK
jgi:multisubunit Na+/H+ antiporter MnhC subunit